MTTPLHRLPVGGAGTGPAIRAHTGRILGAPAIRGSDRAQVPTAYNAEGLIVSAPDPTTATTLGSMLRDVLARYACTPDGPTWLAGDSLRSAADDVIGASGVLAAGVRIVRDSVDRSGAQRATVIAASSGPDPWDVVEELRGRLGPELAGAVGLNHLMTSAEQAGGNPFAIGHGRVGLDGYGVTGMAGHGPVVLTLPPRRPTSSGPRPRVVVLDTGIGDHPWFEADPPLTTVRFSDGRIVGPDVASGPHRSMPTDGAAHGDSAPLDPLLGTVPTHTGHGTFIAGLLRQACPDAEIIALTVMQADGVVPEHKLIRALDVVRSRQRESPGWADALVLSLGYYAETGEDVRYTSGLKDILLDLGRLGVAVFAAAGNDATSRPSYPAAFAVDPEFDDPGVLPLISVAAVAPDGTVAPFSNDGPWVTGEAPGVNLVSASPTLPDAGGRPALAFRGPNGRLRSTADPDDFRGYAVWSGTSFAAPVLAGRYLTALLSHGFPADVATRRRLLPLGRPSRRQLVS